MKPHAVAGLVGLAILSGGLSAQICGDCNGDGAISILDALVAAQIGVGSVVPTPYHMQYCDVDNSGTVAVVDALLMAQEAAGMAVTLTCPPPFVEPEWVRSAGNAGYDRSYGIASENDFIYVAGTRDFVSGAGADAWVMARNPDGTLLWEELLRDPGGGQVELYSIAVDSGTLYVAGTIRRILSPLPDEIDLIVFAMDTTGAVLWQSQIVAGGTHEFLRSIQVRADGSLLVLGDRTPQAGGNAQCWVVNMENTGTIRWQREISAPDGCRPERVAERSGGGLYLVGAMVPPGGSGFDALGWLVSLDATGNILWQFQYTPPGVGNAFTDLIIDSTGLWIVGYICNSCFFLDDPWIVRTDLAGTMATSMLYGNYSATEYDRIDRILALPAGEFATIGGSSTLPMTGRFSTVQVFDAGGNPLWARAFGDTPRFGQAFDAALTTAKAIVFTGISNYVLSPSLADAYYGKILPQSTALDGCPSTHIIVDVPRDVTASTTAAVPPGVTEAATSATIIDPALTPVIGSPTAVDLVHCTN